jgi:DNA topoisomerase-6 subunit A
MKAKAKVKPKAVPALVNMGNGLSKEILSGRNPSIAIPLRNLSNVRFDEERSIIQLGDQKQNRHFFNVAMAKKFMQTLMVAAKCKEHIEQGKTTSLRDMYYMVLKTFPQSTEKTVDEQSETDEVAEDLEVALDLLREELHLFADKRGTLVGEIELEDNGDPIDGRRAGSGGWSVPSIVEPSVIKFKRCTAKFILLVEKAAVWQRLHEDKFWQKHKCILVTGQGQSSRGVRRLLYRLVNELKLPLYVATDNDPWGYYIYSVIKQGSINLAYESMRMAIPSARFIGFSSRDPEKFDLPKGVEIKLNQNDVNRAKQLLEYRWFKKKEWQEEIKYMLKTGNKYELQALSTKDISFITDDYLPRKLKQRDWLD